MKVTPLHDFHVKMGARMIEFAGWEMPVQYTNVTEEHLAVRNAAGMFDVSHMGDIIIRGVGAEDLLRRLLTNDVKGMSVSQAMYAHILDEKGRIMDDTIVTRIRNGEYLMVPNAATTPRIISWVLEHTDKQEIVDAATASHASHSGAKGAGDTSEDDYLQPLSDEEVHGDFVDVSIEGNPIPVIPQDFRPQGFLTEVFSFEMKQRPIKPAKSHVEFSEKCYISRIGYTGEDGFEILLENESAKVLWNILLHIGKEYGLLPAGTRG
ncbi:MAG: hypothetical protein ABSB83_00605 [Methanomassiliicoccales archaeon]|jgi:aminomethyltransferase